MQKILTRQRQRSAEAAAAAGATAAGHGYTEAHFTPTTSRARRGHGTRFPGLSITFSQLPRLHMRMADVIPVLDCQEQNEAVESSEKNRLGSSRVSFLHTHSSPGLRSSRVDSVKSLNSSKSCQPKVSATVVNCRGLRIQLSQSKAAVVWSLLGAAPKSRPRH